jgi:hypothetical protein
VKRYLSFKYAAFALAAALLVGAGAAAAMVFEGGGPPAAPPGPSDASSGPNFDAAFAGAGSPDAVTAPAMTGRSQINREVLEGAVAKLAGMSPKDVRAALQQGKSLAQVAADHGISRDGLKAAIASAEKVYLDRSVQSGLLTQAYADQALQALSARLDQIIDASTSARRPGR